MPDQPLTSPVHDSIPKIDGKVAVGEDLEFQRKWWRFERIIWSLFLLILIADAAGFFGRGWFAKAVRQDSAQTLLVNYERIQRSNTPSIMTLHFGPNAIHDGRVEVFASGSLAQFLWAQRISPQPLDSILGNGGITYTFDATHPPASAEIQLQPSIPGHQDFHMQVKGGQPIDGSIFVLP